MLKMETVLKRIVNEGVVTHYGTDLDQVIALEALRRATGAKEIKIDRAPAGKPAVGRVNVDVGDARATEGVTVIQEELYNCSPSIVDVSPSAVVETVIIDHHFNEFANTCEVLADAGIYVPAQAVEVADRCDRASALDYRSGIALVRYLTPQKTWELAEAGLLTATLTNEQVARFGLKEAVEKQKQVMENAIAAVKKFAVSDDVVFATEQVLGGSFVAYELGYKIFASITAHKKGGVSFAINAAPGTKLPRRVLEWANNLRDQYGPDVFVRPDGGMIVAGGPKNPDFSVPVSVEEIRKVVVEAV